MATIKVRDGDGVEQTVEKPLAPGRAGASASKPVVLATEDKASLDAIATAINEADFYPTTQPVSVSGSVAVTGPLTDTQLRATALPVSGTFWQTTQPVSAASLPLPTGAATAAKQDAIIEAIEGISPSGGSGGDASAAKQDEQTGVLEAIEAALGAALSVTGDFYPETQPVSVSGSIAVTGTFWQGTQPVSVAALPLPTGAATETTLSTLSAKLPASLGAKTDANSLSIVPASNAAFTVAALPAGSNIIGRAGIDQTTDGTTNKVNIDASLKSGTATRTSVNSGTTSATILASNANRKGATIFNSDANALLLDLSGGTAAATRCQVRLTQYQSYSVPSGYTGGITGIWEANGDGIADMVEFT